STIATGTVKLYNSTYNVSYSAPITNGLYSISNVLPYNYSIDITSKGKIYTNFTSISVNGHSEQLQNLTVVMDNLTVSTSVNRYGLSGYTVYLNNTNGSNIIGITGSSGTVSFGVMPGTYNITVKANGTERKRTETFTAYGVGKTVSLTPKLSATVSGNATPSSTISFYHDGIMSDVKNATANSSGYYKISMPYGIYTIYSKADGYVFLKTVNITGNSVINLKGNYSKAEKYTITSRMGSAKNYSGTFELLANKNSTQNFTLLQYSYTNSSMPFTIYLSSTTVYSISGTGTNNSKTLAGFNISNIRSNTNVNINLISAFSNTVLTSTNNTQSYVTQGLMVVYNGSVPYYYSELSGGVATLYYANTTTPSTMALDSPFYYNSTAKITNHTYYAKQKLVDVTINTYNDSNSPYNGTITLIGLDNKYKLDMVKGSNTTTIAEGIYYTMISNKSAYISPVLTGTVVNSSAVQTINKSTDLYFSVTLNATDNDNYTTSIYNSTSVQTSPIHIAAGTYTLYSFNSTQANITTIILNENYTYSPKYEKAYNLSITNSLNISTSYKLANGTKIIITSSGKNVTLILPSYNYTVTASGRFANSTGAYTYGNSTINITKPSKTNSSLNLTLTSTEVYDKLNGTVYYYSNSTPVSGAYIKLMRDGIQVNSTSTTTTYNFTKLVPGTYSVYALLNGTTHYADLANVTLSPFSNMTFNVYLQKADNVTAFGENNSKLVPTIMTVTGSGMLISESVIKHYIYLPTNETYNFTLVNTTSINNVNVNYTGFQSLFLNETSTVNLTLHRVDVYKYVLVDPSVTGNVSQTISTIIKIKNEGNTNYNLSLYSGNSTWKMAFSTENFTLAPGESKNVTVNITIPNAPYGNNSVPVMANVSGKDVLVGNITVYVNKFTNYSVYSNDYAAVNGSINMIPVELINTGNVPILINVSILNNATLLSAYHIVAYTTFNGKNITNVTLPYGATDTIYIYAYGVDGYTLHSLPIKFESYHNSTLKNTTIIKPIFPSATLSTGSSGTSITNDYTADPAITIYIGIGIIVAALLAGIIGSAIRSRRRK
ncbi:MAG: hypothetical protein QXZ44_04460, partial [Ferroplasma sp.]